MDYQTVKHDKGEKFKDNPYNENNKLISKKNIEEVFSKIGFELEIQDLSLEFDKSGKTDLMNVGLCIVLEKLGY